LQPVVLTLKFGPQEPEEKGGTHNGINDRRNSRQKTYYPSDQGIYPTERKSLANIANAIDTGKANNIAINTTINVPHNAGNKP